MIADLRSVPAPSNAAETTTGEQSAPLQDRESKLRRRGAVIVLFMVLAAAGGGALLWSRILRGPASSERSAEAALRRLAIIPFKMRDSFLNPIRGDPQFQRILNQAKARHDAFMRKFFPASAAAPNSAFAAAERRLGL